MPDFGKKLKEVRLSKKMTQKELGDIVGLRGSTISRYENSERGTAITMLGAIAQAFDVSTDYLLGLTDIPYSVSTIESFFKNKYGIKDIENEFHKESLREQLRAAEEEDKAYELDK